MKGKIAFEEHVAIPETLENTKAFAEDSGNWDNYCRQILDVSTERLDMMNQNGIEYAIQSINAPGVQAILDTNEAIEIAKRGNDKLANACVLHPDRFGAFAALPLQDPEAASRELTRCVKELGFKGAMVNGFTQKDTPESAHYYDQPEFRDFWATVAELDVPFYLHPRMQIPSRCQAYDGHPWLKSAPWGFAIETATHSLRLCGSGLFDDFPNLKIIIGHLGEFIPHALWRIDARMKFSRRGYRGKRPLGDYFKDNFVVTTSGFFNNPALRNTLEVMGSDKVLFSTDYPFEQMEDAADWYDNTNIISETERLKIGRTNAIKLFNLKLE
jgi:2,3-dihydroxybenzoate decarboxylase